MVGMRGGLDGLITIAATAMPSPESIRPINAKGTHRRDGARSGR